MYKSSQPVCLFLIVSLLLVASRVVAKPTADEPLEVSAATKEVAVFGIIYPKRFNSAEGEEARYHLLVWKGGTSANALIETPADDLAFHAALVSLGARPGDNLTMASWNKRHEPDHPAPRKKIAGSLLNVRLSWEGKPLGVPIEQAFRVKPEQTNDAFPQASVPSSQSQAPGFEWRFGGNRNRLFNNIPLARPGCLVCLYSCPSGKVSNGALSVHEYVENPSHFAANTALLPPDGTPVIITFRVAQ